MFIEPGCAVDYHVVLFTEDCQRHVFGCTRLAAKQCFQFCGSDNCILQVYPLRAITLPYSGSSSVFKGKYRIREFPECLDYSSIDQREATILKRTL